MPQSRLPDHPEAEQPASWPLALALTISHTTRPDAASLDRSEPIASARRRGESVRMSLLAQLAAHESLLRWLGLPAAPFVEEEWRVVHGRESNPRLIRGSFTCGRGEAIGGALGDAADYLRLSGLGVDPEWVKADHVFANVERILRPARRTSWLRRSAVALEEWPGERVLQRIINEKGLRLSFAAPVADERVASVAGALAESAAVIHVGGESASPLQPGSAFRNIASLKGRDAAAAERIEAALEGLGRVVFVVTRWERFDDRSRNIIRLLAAGRQEWSWLVEGEPPPVLASAGPFEQVPGARAFVVSPRLGWRRSFEETAGRLHGMGLQRWLDDFSTGDGLSRFLATGTLPNAYFDGIEEPLRSYLAALALVGPRIPVRSAARFLEPLGCVLDAEALSAGGVLRVEDGAFVFRDESTARSLRSLVPPDARAGLCRLAVEKLEDECAGTPLLLLRAGDERAADELLKRLSELGECEAEQILEVLEELRPAPRADSPLARLLVELLIRTGRYARARSSAERLQEPWRSLCAATVARRQGRYADALATIRRIPESVATPTSLLLEAELTRLQGDSSAAERILTRVESGSAATDGAAAFERSLLAIDRGDVPSTKDLRQLASAPYLEARLKTYLALRERRWSDAASSARRAFSLAASLPERIDAGIDRMYVRFIEGEWEESLVEAREMLALVGEAEGDRAAAGVLFTVAYLSADSGQWQRAEEMIRRLRAFYRRAGDARRLREVHLIEAHLAFCRGDFAFARAAVGRLDLDDLHADEKEAALLVLDEIDSMEGVLREPRSRGAAESVELRDRHALLARRCGAAVEPLRPFNRALAEWEERALQADAAAPPVPGNKSEELKLLRSMQYLGRKRGSALAHVEALAEKLGVGASGEGCGFDESELGILQMASTLAFPYDAGAFNGRRWLFARRNRLGIWNQLGPDGPRPAEDLDEMAVAPEEEWIACGEDALLRFEGSGKWSPGTRASLAAIFLMKSENQNLRRAVEQSEIIAERPSPEPEGIVAESPKMRQVLELVGRVARRDVPVCIEGESGVGKELVARAIHAASARRSGPFVAINCAALPESLIESELFGHARGAFTGADRDKPGVIESADRGTLFLDELGELPLPAQAKLLRFLQEGEIRRIGENAPRKADVRIVAATNRELEKEVDEGRFREDLYYRVRGVELHVPPLRERGGDVLLLASHFLARESRREASGPSCFSEEALQALQLYDWPGNVRELENVVRSAHALAPGKTIELEHLHPRMRVVRGSRQPAGGYFDEVTRFRRSLVERSLETNGGNQSRAAANLGMSRQALAYQIRELGIVVRKR